MAATDLMNSVDAQTIGLALGVGDHEYPLWALLDASQTGRRVEHVRVTTRQPNVSMMIARPVRPLMRS
jgi:hypothetical protein